MEMINKNEAKLEISMIFVQPSSRLMYFLMGWLLVLGLNDCLVKCATVCVRSMVILRMASQMIECYQFRCHFAESQEMACYLKREAYSGPISFEVQRND